VAVLFVCGVQIQGVLPMSKPDPASRRQLLKALTLGVPAAVVARTAGAASDPPSKATSADTAPSAPRTRTWLFFNTDEARAMDAIVARIIPADDLGPGAKEANVAIFIDAQLAGAWGNGDQFYRSGPFVHGTLQQGYQLSYTPAEMFRIGLSKLDQAARRAHGDHAFADLDEATQDRVLAQMEKGDLDFSPLPASTFFTAITDITIEGFFSDPMYGGNADMVGWKLVGFPGAYASYLNDIERHGVQWTGPPVSIATGKSNDMMPGMNHGEKNHGA
jgi:gluconate 2-dehydrogenase gamma chain